MTSSQSKYLSRRQLIASVAAVPICSMPDLTPAAAGSGVREWPPLHPDRPLLIRGGNIISMDTSVGDVPNGDILIVGKKIAAIGRDLRASGARTIEASGMIIIPGFVDAHRHAWQGQLRRLNPNAATLSDYASATHHSFGRFYRPKDMYVGNLLTALSCIDSGITCIIDNSHNSRTRDHSNMAIQALLDSGIRAVHASGAPGAGDWDRQWPNDLIRLKKEFFRSEDQLVTLAMFAPLAPELWRVARELGIRIHSEISSSQRGRVLDEFAHAGLLGSDVTFNHCAGLAASSWLNIKESGAAINVCPRSDSQYALDDGIPAFQQARDYGLKPGFSVDNETSYGGDMFTEMHVAFHVQRAIAANRVAKGDINAPSPVLVREILMCATVNGAVCAGLSAKIGRLAPGMDADIVLIRADGIDLYPVSNAIGTVVSAADRRSVDTVVIGGKIRKYKGRMVGVDMKHIRAAVDESRNYLDSKVGYQPDIFADRLSLP